MSNAELTREEKQVFFNYIKFLPRTYKILVEGYGNEFVFAGISKNAHKFWGQTYGINLHYYICDDDYDVNSSGIFTIPKYADILGNQEWYEIKNSIYVKGADTSAYTVVSVLDECDKVVWSSRLDLTTLAATGIPCNVTVQSLPSRKAYFKGKSTLEGIIYGGDIHLTDEFDAINLTFNYINIDNEDVMIDIHYMGVNIDNTRSSMYREDCEFYTC